MQAMADGGNQTSLCPCSGLISSLSTCHFETLPVDCSRSNWFYEFGYVCALMVSALIVKGNVPDWPQLELSCL